MAQQKGLKNMNVVRFDEFMKSVKTLVKGEQQIDLDSRTTISTLMSIISGRKLDSIVN